MNVTIYLPDELGKKAKKAGINVSKACQRALKIELEEEFVRYCHGCGRAENLSLSCHEAIEREHRWFIEEHFRAEKLEERLRARRGGKDVG